MHFGLYIPLFDELADPALVARLGAEAEEAGWDGVFVWDQVRWREPVVDVADPQITLAAVAGATERIRLGPMVTSYSRQAEHYDETCSASPSVLRPVLEALAGAPGRRLADIGGGTGNYALALEDAGPSRLGLVHCKRVGWPGPRHRLRVNRAVEFESGAASSPAGE